MFPVNHSEKDPAQGAVLSYSPRIGDLLASKDASSGVAAQHSTAYSCLLYRKEAKDHSYQRKDLSGNWLLSFGQRNPRHTTRAQ